MKKINIIKTILFLLLIGVGINTVAQQTVTFNYSGTPVLNQQIEIPIILNSPDLLGYDIYIKYDKNVLTYIS
jgi:hypothetical protein